jgi:hypothetical protein
MSQITAADLLKKPNAGDNFAAFEDSEKFLDSNLFVFHDANTEFFIIGNDSNKHTVALSVPTSLAGDGPHTVELPLKTLLKWEVIKSSVSKPIKSGSVNVTFSNNRKTVKGTVDLKLESGSNVTGDFSITR